MEIVNNNSKATVELCINLLCMIIKVHMNIKTRTVSSMTWTFYIKKEMFLVFKLIQKLNFIVF